MGRGGELVDRALLKRLRDELPAVMPRALARAVKIVRAKRWSRGSNLAEGNEAKDLVHDAVLQILERNRAWPPGLDLEALLVGVVRSSASHLVEGPANRHDNFAPEVADAQQAKDPEQIPAPTPEQLLQERQSCDVLVREAFDAAGKDPVLNKIIEALMEGHEKANDIASAKGLTLSEVYEGNRRLRRRLDAAAAKRRRP